MVAEKGRRTGRPKIVKDGQKAVFYLPRAELKKLDRLVAEDPGCRSRSEMLRRFLVLL